MSQERAFTVVDAAFLEQLADTISDAPETIENNRHPLVFGLRDIAKRVAAAVPPAPIPLVKSATHG